MAESYKDNTIVEIIEAIDLVNALDISKDLVRSKELGKFGFEEREFEFALFQKLVNRIDVGKLGYVPHELLTRLNRELREMIQLFGAIKNFDLKKVRDIENEKNGWLRKFDEVDARITPTIVEAVQIIKALDSSGDEQKPLVEEKMKEVLKFLQDTEKSVNDALSRVKAKLEGLGSADYAVIFLKESQRHFRASVGWLTVIVLLLITTIGYAFYLLYYPPVVGTGNELLQVTISKVLIFTGLFMGLSLTIRNYKAQKHNQVVNKHRHNALITFEMFTAASSDPDTKNAVLLEATRSIFSNQTTGFHSSESTDADYPNRIIEIIKSSKPG